MSDSLRIPPQNIESERAFLGSVMLRPEAVYDITDVITSDSFYAEKHRVIFKSMMELYGKKEPIDLLSLGARLKEKNQLEAIGGRSYLTELVSSVPSSANLKYYAEIIQRKFILRKLLESSDFLGELGYNEEEEIETLLDSAEKKIFGLGGLITSRRYYTLKESLDEAWERLDRLHKKEGGLRGVPTGFKELDHLLSGFQKSDLIILAARPSVGKTALALDIARGAACTHNVPVGIFSLEMSSQQLVDRILAAESRVDAWKLRTGQLKSDNEFMHIQSALARLSKAPIYFDDTPANTLLNMRSVARRLKREHGMELLVIDYLQLIAPPRAYDSMVQQVTEISRGLKGLARELEIPVIALSQLNRAIEQRRDKPRLSDLRDSGCLAGDTCIMNAQTGEFTTIKQLSLRTEQTPFPIFSIDQNYKESIQYITKAFPSGKKKVFLLQTRSGRTIKASANHPFLKLQGWKRLDELSLGDKIAVFGKQKLSESQKSDIVWDEIVSLESLGVKETYDATVPGAHNFLANDIFVHNSLEQDSDVVMFIHNADRYKDEGEKTDRVEILIEKHRNGPTGKVELYFDRRRASFMSVDKERNTQGEAQEESADKDTPF